MSAGWKGGSTRAWRERRALVLAMARYRCQLRVPGVCVGTSDPMHVHHVHGKGSGCAGCRADRLDHLQAACAPCNLHVGDPTKGLIDPPCEPVTRW